jgi:hypothetical protein
VVLEKCIFYDDLINYAEWRVQKYLWCERMNISSCSNNNILVS